MADVTDVADALVAMVAAALYPNGIGQASAAGVACKIYQGWPQPPEIDADLAQSVNKVHVSVYPRDDERNVDQYPNEAQTIAVNPVTLTATIAGQQVTIGGAVPTPTFYAHNVSLLISGKFYVYAAQNTDTASTIATALTALLVVDFASAVNVGAVITLPAGARVTAARVGTIGQQYREVKRQERGFQITVWANGYAPRKAVASIIDQTIGLTQFITLIDGFGGRVRYRSSPMSDALEKTRIYRRDFFITVEYPTTQLITATQVTQLTETVGTPPPSSVTILTINQ